MAMYNYYDDRAQVPQYYYDHYPSYYYPSSSEQAPMTFLDPRRPDVYRRDDRYMDDGYRYNYRLQDYSDYSRHGHMPQEQVVRRDGGPANVPWWLDREYPNHGGYVGMYHLPPQPWRYETREDSGDSTRVEMYVPLCCDECERKVRKHLKNIEGVQRVTADQWQKKVVVVGHDLRPDVLLRRMQRDKPGSVFWSDRSH